MMEQDQKQQGSFSQKQILSFQQQPKDSQLQIAKKKTKKKKLPNSHLLANLSETKYAVVKKAIKVSLGIKITKDPNCMDWDLFWTDNAVTPEQLSKMKPHQKINHFPGMFSLSRKNYLARNLTKMQKKFASEYNFFPKTWVLPSQLNELRAFMESETHPVVIAKPEASCQGKGIFLSKSMQDFDFGQHYVVQKYMKKPFILDGLKFDLRVYVLVAGCDPLRLYIYKQGLARFATENYQIPKKQNLDNLYMHLTNYAINKLNNKFQFNNSQNEMDKGHKRSLTSVLNRIQEEGHNRQLLWENIKDKIAKTMISAQPLLAHHYRSCQQQNYSNNMCFEVLGFDVILDQHLKPQILEVNYTPSFTTDTPLDKFIKENIVKESLILMNLTNKAKNDVISQKRKQILERTLTGKKVWHSKQSRQMIVKRCQQARDAYESKHLGNFEKILPTEKPLLKERYDEFLAYSEECYHSGTGANIRRNNKVVSNSNLQTGDSRLKQGISSQNVPVNTKLTATENLEKIYKTKFRPMMPKKKKDVESKIQVVQMINNKTISSKSTMKPTNLRPYEVGSKQKTRNALSMKKGISNIYNITFNQKGRDRQ